ncbi:flagellar basal body-associated protein FliL [Rhodobacteraceae bacterium XHP0102]|nr:flagellar basal body-associated protein FliL [Rhodobacteraceae bacterium XHP0102]
MLRILIPVLFILLGIGLGAGAGIMLRPTPEMAETESEAEDADPNSTSDTAQEDISADTAQDGTTPQAVENSAAIDGRVMPGSTANLEYVRLNNQFIVPIVREGTVRSLVVLSLVLEVETGQNQLVFNREPRLRDALLRVMFAHANAGGFDDVFTSSLAMTPLRQGMREAAIAVLGHIVNDVLIVDIMRQDA